MLAANGPLGNIASQAIGRLFICDQVFYLVGSRYNDSTLQVKAMWYVIALEKPEEGPSVFTCQGGQVIPD
jgi:hypothetical protein